MSVVSTNNCRTSSFFLRLYYQHSPSRLSACPVTVHSLLHIADGIEACGPVWAYWAFPMERFCGLLLPCIKSRRFPYANIDSHVVATAQISQIKNRYGLQEELSLRPPRAEILRGALSVPACEKFPLFISSIYIWKRIVDPTCVLLRPRVTNPVIPPGLLTKINICLQTRYKKPANVIRRYLDVNEIESWGKVKILNGGDTINAPLLVKSQEDRRDASYVRVGFVLFS